MGCLIGTVWFGQSDGTSASIFPTTGALFLTINNTLLDTLFTLIMLFPAKQALLKREYFNGTYSLLAFFLSELVCGVITQTM